MNWRRSIYITAMANLLVSHSVAQSNPSNSLRHRLRDWRQASPHRQTYPLARRAQPRALPDSHKAARGPLSLHSSQAGEVGIAGQYHWGGLTLKLRQHLVGEFSGRDLTKLGLGYRHRLASGLTWKFQADISPYSNSQNFRTELLVDW